MLFNFIQKFAFIIFLSAFAAVLPANAQTKAKIYRAVGVVEKVNLKTGRVKINHENIEGLMEAMTMDFEVRRKSMLKRLKAGDKVRFEIEDRTLTITKISKIANAQSKLVIVETIWKERLC